MSQKENIFISYIKLVHETISNVIFIGHFSVFNSIFIISAIWIIIYNNVLTNNWNYKLKIIFESYVL